MSRHVAVVGGGVVGLFTALELRAAGAQVTLLERASPFAEASWAGAGVLFPMQPWRYPASVWARVQHSLAHYRALAAAGHADIGLLRSGAWISDEPDRALAWCERNGVSAEPQQRHGQPGVLVPGVWQVRNPRLGRVLADRTRSLGVELLTGGAVQRLVIAPESVGVQRSVGPALSVDAVVLCTGVWTDELLAGSGLCRLGISPVKGEMLLLDDPGLGIADLHIGHGAYLVPRGDGRVLLGATECADDADPRPTPAARADLLERAAALCPPAAALDVRAQWTGLRPWRAGGEPFVGAHPQCPRVLVHAGHYRNGLGMAPATARELRERLFPETAGAPGPGEAILTGA